MITTRRVLARTLLVAFALSALAPSGAFARPKTQTPAPMQSAPPVTVPSPAPMPTTSGTPIPYPAYGTPAPDVAKLAQKPGIPVSVTLSQAIDIAVVQSPAFASERAAYREIFARVGAEEGAIFPGVSASGSIGRDYTKFPAGTVAIGATPVPSGTYTTSESGSIDISQLIFDGGRAIAAIRSAKEANIAGRDTLLRQLQTLSYTVATAYYTLLEDKASIASDNALVREFEINENYISAEIRTGAAARSDLAAAQFETAQARGSLVSAQGLAIQAEGTFATTLGLDADTQIVPQQLSKTPPQAKLLTYPQSLQEAYMLRPDYLAAQYTLTADQENLRYAKLARFPSITGSASIGGNRAFGPNTPTTGFSSTQSIGAQISIPIYDQGQTNYSVAVAAATLDQALASLTQTRLTVQSDVRGGLANLISSRASLVQAQAEVTSATVSLQATQAQYKVGASTITAIVTAEANLATAQRDFIAALYTERLSEENYAYVLGASDLKL
jgi:outer membrane protein